MNRLRSFGIRLLNLFRSNYRDVATELNSHLDLAIEENRKAGLSEDEARRQALMKLGGLEQTKELIRDQQSLPFLDALLQDTRYAFRTILRSPGLTAVALLSLALGIGANTAIFSLMDAVLLKSLPVHDPQPLVLFGNGLDEGISDGFPNPYLFSYPFYRQMQKQNQVFSDVAAAFSMTDRIHGFVQGRVEAEPMSIQLVSGTYFPMLGVQPLVGRMLSEDDDKTEGGHPVAVISYAWWNPNDQDIHHNVIGPNYFNALGIPLLAGRNFGLQDTASSPKVGIISESTARILFPEGSPIGRHYGYGGPENANDIEVIGVAKDVKYNFLDEPLQFGDYLPMVQTVRYLRDFSVRYSGDSTVMVASVRQAIHDVDPTLPISDAITLNEQITRSISNQRLVAQLSTFFSLLALFLSCIGIYGLMSYLVTRRTNEIGIRMTLGAPRPVVLWHTLKESLHLVGIGIAIGLPLAFITARLISSMLFGLRSTDPTSLFIALAILLTIAALACYLPARRASQVDPIIALRYE
jgi:MacB-like periplasmic core domain/FtsX-like permease family